ncbi:hypothetical protein, partial [Vibrio cholerae]
LKYKYDKKLSKNRRDELEDIILKAEKIDNTHLRFLKLISNEIYIFDSNSFSRSLEFNRNAFDKSKKSKKKKIFSNMCTIY